MKDTSYQIEVRANALIAARNAQREVSTDRLKAAVLALEALVSLRDARLNEWEKSEASKALGAFEDAVAETLKSVERIFDAC